MPNSNISLTYDADLTIEVSDTGNIQSIKFSCLVNSMDRWKRSTIGTNNHIPWSPEEKSEVKKLVDSLSQRFGYINIKVDVISGSVTLEDKRCKRELHKSGNGVFP